MGPERLAVPGDEATLTDVGREDQPPAPHQAATSMEGPKRSSELGAALRTLAVPILVGVAVRLALMPFTSWSKDDSIWWLATANGVQHVGLYQRIGYSYPPLAGDLLQGMGWLLQHLGATSGSFGHLSLGLEPAAGGNGFSALVTTPLFNLCFKTVLAGFDLATGLLVYAVCHRATGDAAKSKVAFCLWFLNPFVIFETGVFGAFDQLVAFGVLAAVALFLWRRPFWAGTALGLAIMAKGAPGFVLPLLVLVTWDRAGPGVASRARATAPLVGGVLVSIAALAVPLWATDQLGPAVQAVFARTSGPQFGGFSVLGLLNLRGLDALAGPVGGWAGLGRTVLGLQLLGGVVLGVVGMLRARRSPTSAVVGTTALVLVVVVMLGPQANPQYVLWFLPLLAVLYGIWRRGLAGIVLFSLVALVKVLVLYGPAAFVFPMVLEGWVSSRAVVHDVLTWGDLPQLFWSSGTGSYNFTGPLSIVGVAGLVMVVRATLWRSGERRRRVIGMLPRPRRTLVVPVVGAVLAVAVGSSALVAAADRGASVSLRASASGGIGRVNASVVPGASLEALRLVEFPVAAPAVPSTVVLYDDPHYPVVGTTRQAVDATTSTITNTLVLRGFHGRVRTIGERGLSRLLRDTAEARSTVLVNTSGILPATVFSGSEDLVTPWLRAGGTMYWGGAPPGYFSGHPGQADNGAHYPGSLGTAGLARFFDPGLLSGAPSNPYHLGAIPSATARALGLVYRFDQGGPRRTGPGSPVTAAGWGEAGRSSLSVVATGRGQLVILGGLVYSQRLVAPDISLLIMSGATRRSGPIVSVDVPGRVVRGGGHVRWTPPAVVHSGSVVVALDPSASGLLFERTVVP